MAIRIPGLRVDASAGDTGVSALTTPESGLSEAAGTVNVMADITIRKETRDAAAYNIGAGTDLEIYGAQAINEARTEAEKPGEITDLFVEKYKGRYQELREQAPNEIARRDLDKRFGQLNAGYAKRAIVTQISETQNFRNNIAEDAYEKVSTAMLNGDVDYKGAKDMSGSITASLEPFVGPAARIVAGKKARQNLASLKWDSRGKTEQYKIWRDAKQPVPDQIKTTFNKAAEKSGLDPKLYYTVAMLESGMNPEAKNKNSSAGGIFQQLDANAKQFGVKDRYDVGQSTAGVTKFWLSNEKQMVKVLGRKATNAEMYLAHQQGAGGAMALLSKPTERAVDVLTEAHGGGEKARELAIKAVKNNGGKMDMTADEFSDVWLDKYDSVESGVSRDFVVDKTESEFDDLSVGDKLTAGKQMASFETELISMRRDDFGQWGDIMGLDDDAKIAAQGGPKRAVILSIDNAKRTVEHANSLDSVDDVFKMATQLKERGGDNYAVLMRDLRKQKLNPRVESAINLSNLDPATYKEHIELFMDGYKMDKSQEVDSRLSGQFKRAGHDEATLVAELNSDVEDLRALMLREGNSGTFTANEIVAHEKLAMTHLINNPDSSMSESIEFALAPLLNHHNIITLPGGDVRIPIRDKNKKAMDANIMQTRVGFAYEDLIKQIQADKDTAGELFDEDLVFPTLNADESGVILRDLNGTPYLDNDGLPYKINFIRMQSQEFITETKERQGAFDLNEALFNPHRQF